MGTLAPLLNCVTLCKALDSLRPQFSHLERGDSNSIYLRDVSIEGEEKGRVTQLHDTNLAHCKCAMMSAILSLTKEDQASNLIRGQERTGRVI